MKIILYLHYLIELRNEPELIPPFNDATFLNNYVTTILRERMTFVLTIN